MNLSHTRSAALQLLEHPESYPGLAIRKPAHVRMRIWRYPSSEPFVSWAVLDVKGDLFVRRVAWDQAPTPLPDPTTYGSEAPLEVEVFKGMLARLQSIAIPPFRPSGGIGLDGTRYGLETSDFMSSSHLSWWEDNPSAWEPLREWHERAMSEFEALLPQHSVATGRREP